MVLTTDLINYDSICNCVTHKLKLYMYLSINVSEKLEEICTKKLKKHYALSKIACDSKRKTRISNKFVL